MLTTFAYAEDVAAEVAAQPSYMGLVPLLLMFVVFYFFLIRPQMKRQKTHLKMVQELAVGDKIITAGGLHATVTKIEDDVTLQARIAPNVQVRVVRSTIAETVQHKSKPEKSAKETSSSLESDTETATSSL